MAEKHEIRTDIRPKGKGKVQEEVHVGPTATQKGIPSKEEKLRHDILEAARRYEKLRLYGEAHRCYRKIGAKPDAARVRKKMLDIYPEFAKKFEREGRLEEALKLYKDMEMPEDVARIEARMMKEGRYLQLPPEIQKEVQDESHPLWRQPNIERTQFEEGLHVGSFVKEDEAPTEGEIAEGITEATTEPAKDLRPGDTHKDRSHDINIRKDRGKNFKICPYCGEELDLPKPPKFCPFCREAFN